MTRSTDGASARSGYESRIAPLLLLSAGMVLFAFRATDWFQSVPGDLGDARFNSVILEHLHRWVRGEAGSLWSPPFFYPAHGTLAFSDNHFGSGLAYILFRLFGLGRELAFDAWFSFGCALNFIAMYVAMRRLRFGPLAASTAAFVFAFNLPAFLQAGHAQLTYRFATPMAYLAFLRWAEDRRIQRLVPLAGWGALQFFCSIYLGVFLVYLLAATAVAMLLPRLRPLPASRLVDGNSTKRDDEGNRARSLVMILGCAAATAWLLLQYQLISRSYGFGRSPAEVLSMLPRPSSYLVADRVDAYQWLARWTQGIPARQEHQMFLGFVPLALALWGILSFRGAEVQRQRLLGISLVSLALLVAATLIIGDTSIYRLFMALPGVSSIRAVSRVILVMALPVAIMAAMGVESLQRLRFPGAASVILLVAAFSLETFAFRPIATPISEWRDRSTPLEKAIDSEPLDRNSVIYVTGRTQDPDFMPELDAMIFAQDHGLPTLNGYSGNVPPGYLSPSPCTSPAVRIQSMADSVFKRSDTTRSTLLQRTRWIALEKCPRHVMVDLADAPPDETQARGIHLGASIAKADRDSMEAIVRIRNDGSRALHSMSRAGSPLRLSWRFVRLPSSGPEPGWDGRQDLMISLLPGEQEDVKVSMRPPSEPGLYDLQFSLVAEGHAWLHDLGMAVSHTKVELAETKARP